MLHSAGEEGIMPAPETEPQTDVVLTEDVACDICATTMIAFNCELICLNCGFRRDCSDP